jgi:hypothetical protein
VPRLSLEAVRALAAPTGADGDAIHRLTLGNAFFATEILAAEMEELPETVRDAVLARVAQLGPEARRLLDVAALVPRGRRRRASRRPPPRGPGRVRAAAA